MSDAFLGTPRQVIIDFLNDTAKYLEQYGWQRGYTGVAKYGEEQGLSQAMLFVAEKTKRLSVLKAGQTEIEPKYLVGDWGTAYETFKTYISLEGIEVPEWEDKQPNAEAVIAELKTAVAELKAG